MLPRHVTRPARHYLHGTVLEVGKDVLLHAEDGCQGKGGRKGGDHLKARGSNKQRGTEEKSSYAPCVCKTSRMARKMAATATAPGSG